MPPGPGVAVATCHVVGEKRAWVFEPLARQKGMSRDISQNDLILLYRKTIRPLYAYVSKRVGGDRGLAEDIVQETWMKALDSWPRNGLPEEPVAWLRQVARNALASHFRQRRPLQLEPGSIDLGDERFSPDTPDAAALVSWGMARLRRPQVELLEAFHFDGKSVAEIAAEWRVSERAIEGRLRRARGKLRKKLERALVRSAVHHGRPANGENENAR